MGDKEKQMTSTDVLNQMGEIRNTVDILKESIHEQVKQRYGVNEAIFNDILGFDYEEIDDVDVNKLRSFLSQFTDTESLNALNEKDDNAIYEEMKDIKKLSLLALSMELEALDMEESISEELKDMTPDLSSKATTNERIKQLQEKSDASDDDKEKSRISNVIKTLESTLDFSFFVERISKLGEEELQRIIEGFLYPTKGEYIMKKYQNKIGKFSISSDVFTHFMNIEESFLDDEYEPFNNLFLFMYIRYIAFADPHNKKDRVFVSSLTSAISSLKAHNFADQQDEEDFKNFIKSVLDNFMDYKDLFIEHNATYKGHKVRQEHDAKVNEAKRKIAIEECLKFKFEYDENLSTDELVEYVNDEKDKMIRKQVEAYREREHINDIDDTEDDSEDEDTE